LILAGLWAAPAIAADDPMPAVTIYSRDHAPAAPKLEELPLKDSLKQYGITWTFEQPARVGRFITGDYYVVGPVTIKDIDPRPLFGKEVPEGDLVEEEKKRKDGAYARNGSMLDPPAAQRSALTAWSKTITARSFLHIFRSR
jgi:hypothetical protein